MGNLPNKDQSLMGCYAVSLGKWIPVFLRIMMPSPLRQKSLQQQHIPKIHLSSYKIRQKRHFKTLYRIP